VLNLLTLGLGFLPAFFGGRRALHDRCSDTFVVRQGAIRWGILLPVFLLVPISIWASVRWIHRQDRLANLDPALRVGYLDRQGRVLIPPRFRAGKAFTGQRAVAWIGTESFSSEPSGPYLIDPGGRALSSRLESPKTEIAPNGCLLAEQRDGSMSYFASDGRRLFAHREVIWFPEDPRDPVVVKESNQRMVLCRLDEQSVGTRGFAEVGFFKDGHAGYREGRKWGLLDREGRTLIPPRFDLVVGSAHERALVQVGRHFGLVDLQGRWIVPPRFEMIRPFDAEGPGLTRACEGGHWGFIRLDGSWAIEPRFEELRAFTTAGYARAMQGGRWGVIDSKGAWVLPAIYEELLPPREAPFAFRQGRNWGYVALGGRVLVPPVLSRAGGFRQGSAFGRGLHRWIHFDVQGHATPLPGVGLAEVTQDELISDMLPFLGVAAP